MHAGPSRHELPVVGIDDRAAAAIGRLAFTGATRPVVLSFPANRSRAQPPADQDIPGWQVIRRTSTRPPDTSP